MASSFYHFRAGDLFYSLLVGTPAVAWLYGLERWGRRFEVSLHLLLRAQDLERYWEHNQDLAQELDPDWDNTVPTLKAFPLRLYGDGADTIGLNTFELLSMISVSPQHSSTMMTRIVCLGCFIYSMYVSNSFGPGFLECQLACSF